MTTGPEPMIRTDSGFRPASTALCTDWHRVRPPTRGDEAVEDGERIQRAGRALGVVLDGLNRQLHVAQALDRPIVEVHLADAEAAAARQRLADDLDLVVLGR